MFVHLSLKSFSGVIRRKMLLDAIRNSSPVHKRALAQIILATFFVSLLVDLPRVLNMPTRIYLPRGMAGKIECKVDANPPVMRIIWSRNGIILDVSGISRIKINQQGILVINPVTMSDEGNYSCKPYSPLGGGEPSLPVQVLVRGWFFVLIIY